jgi:hypothetical protein
MGVIGYTIAGTSNHQYAKSTTVALTGGTPTVAAVPGAVTVTSVAGQGTTLAFAGYGFPATYGIYIGDLGQDAVAYVTSRTQAGFTLNINPRLTTETLAAGAVDIQIVA